MWEDGGREPSSYPIGAPGMGDNLAVRHRLSSAEVKSVLMLRIEGVVEQEAREKLLRKGR